MRVKIYDVADYSSENIHKVTNKCPNNNGKRRTLVELKPLIFLDFCTIKRNKTSTTKFWDHEAQSSKLCTPTKVTAEQIGITILSGYFYAVNARNTC